MKSGDLIRTTEKTAWFDKGEYGTLEKFDTGSSEIKLKSGKWWCNANNFEAVGKVEDFRKFCIKGVECFEKYYIFEGRKYNDIRLFRNLL